MIIYAGSQVMMGTFKKRLMEELPGKRKSVVRQMYYTPPILQIIKPVGPSGNMVQLSAQTMVVLTGIRRVVVPQTTYKQSVL